MITLLRQQDLAVAQISTHSVNLAFGPNQASKINVGLGPSSGL